MRVARLVGLSPDGRFVIVATERGEELAIAADDRLRAALRGDRPRLGQLEIEMESALSPREIQTRIRSGESVDDVARVAGIERDRVERFAAPVIAEREHVAGLAMTSSARRRGETSSHRTLRGVLTERLQNRGVDVDTVAWDSYRLADGRWAVTADYLSGETPRQALFFFDVPGRYSVAGNDEGRWVLGDTSPSRGPQPGRRPPAPDESEDTEPTLDLSDELALVRAIQDVPVAPATGEDAPGSGPGGALEDATEAEVTIAEVVQFHRASGPAPAEESDLDTELAEVTAELDRLEAEGRADSGRRTSDEIVEEPDSLDDTATGVEPDDNSAGDEPDEVEPAEVEPEATVAGEESGLPGDAADPEAAEPTIAVAARVSSPAEPDVDGHLVEDVGPSDASAVPELSVPLSSEAWEPAIVVDYPVEPSEDDGFEVPEGSDDPGRPEAPVAGEDRRDEAATLPVVPWSAEPARAVEPDAPDDVGTAATDEPTSADPEDQPLPLDVPDQPTPPPAPKPARRKRASVPSWDEIVFGGPKEP